MADIMNIIPTSTESTQSPEMSTKKTPGKEARPAERLDRCVHGAVPTSVAKDVPTKMALPPSTTKAFLQPNKAPKKVHWQSNVIFHEGKPRPVKKSRRISEETQPVGVFQDPTAPAAERPSKQTTHRDGSKMRNETQDGGLQKHLKKTPPNISATAKIMPEAAGARNSAPQVPESPARAENQPKKVVPGRLKVTNETIIIGAKEQWKPMAKGMRWESHIGPRAIKTNHDDATRNRGQTPITLTQHHQEQPTTCQQAPITPHRQRPPPAPRPARLPTPDLPELSSDKFFFSGNDFGFIGAQKKLRRLTKMEIQTQNALEYIRNSKEASHKKHKDDKNTSERK